MLPPYARAVVNERSEGRHPSMIILGLSSEWFRVNDPTYPFVFVPEAQFALGKFEWWWVAGVPVWIDARECDTASYLQLASEVADWTGPVLVTDGLHYQDTDVADIMREISRGQFLAQASWVQFNPANDPWPQWWTWERHRQYEQRCAAWRAAQDKEQLMAAHA